MRLFRHTQKKRSRVFCAQKKSLVFGHATDFYGGGDHPNNDDASFSDDDDDRDDDDFWWGECATGKKTRSGACVCFGGAKNKCAFKRQKRFKEMASSSRFPKTTTLCDVLDDDDDGQKRNGGGKGRRRRGNHHVEDDER